MFEWLKREIASIETRKFHVNSGPFSSDLQQAIENSKITLPPSYKAFLFEFGDVKLYRRGSYYLIEIFRVPNEIQADGEWLLQIGKTDGSLVYFKESLLLPNAESPVFEWRHNSGMRKSADSFAEWMEKKCRAAKGRFKKHEWAAIEKGPPPFDEREKAIVEARRNFHWKVIGSTADGDVKFEVYNDSEMVLPYLSIGVRGKNSDVNGGVWLPVSDVKPGEIRVISKDCYKEVLPPSNVEAFSLPDPSPEDREQYWEFR